MGIGLAAGEVAAADPLPLPQTGSTPWVGVQIAPHSFYDEGIEPCLDLLQETAGINAVVVYSHTYYSATGLDGNREWRTLARDHGKTPPNPMRRRLPLAWVRHQERLYRDTFLRHPSAPRDSEFAGREIFRDILPASKQRGVRVYARILEPWTANYARAFAKWNQILNVDVYGRPGIGTCYHHPAYRAFWQATVDDLMSSYELDGLQWGSERNGPLGRLLLFGAVPHCFCEHCLAAGRKKGIDVDRARTGFQRLHAFVTSLGKGTPQPSDGVFIEFLRHLFAFPEILAWESLWRAGHEEFCADIYRTAKRARKSADIGRHIDHQCTSWDPFYRAEFSYAEMAQAADFLKPILYHDVLGPRFRNWCVEPLRKSLLHEFSGPDAQRLLYTILGYDPAREPGWEASESTGFTPAYVESETRRCVQGAVGRARVYAGIGIDVPWNGKTAESKPETTEEATMRALSAGASGILISREYDEMRVANLRAIGRAVRAHSSNRRA